MTVAMPAPDQTVLSRRGRIVAGLRAIVPGEGVIAAEREMRPYESDGLTAYRQLPMVVVLPETTEQVSRVLALLPRRTHQGGAARGRHLALGWRAAARGRRPSRHGQVQSHPRDRLRKPRGRGRAGRHQPGGDPGGRASRLLLCARSVFADRLHHRRQRGGKFRRRALPQIRHDHQQPARLRAGADDRRGHPYRRQASRCRRLRSARRHYRLGGPAGRRHRDYGAYPEEAGMRARRAGRLCLFRRCRRMREQDHRRGHHPRRHGDDGPAGDPRGRGVCACRISARGRGPADRRGRRSASRGRPPGRARRGNRQSSAVP